METEFDYNALKKSDECKRGFKLMRNLEKEKLKILLYRAETILELEEIKDRRFDNKHTASLYNTCLESLLGTDKMIAEVTEMQRIMHDKLRKNIYS